MSFGAPKVPDIVPPPNPATMADPSIASAASQSRQMTTGGLPSTLLTGSLGDTSSASTSGKKLLGS